MSPSDPAIEPVQFRKRPTTIWAMQWTGDNLDAIQAFVGPSPSDPGPAFNKFAGDHYLLYVAANRSWLPLQVGEWVAKDSLGFYPIKDAVFVDTYDRADGDTSKRVSTPFLDVDIRCHVPGQLNGQEAALLERLHVAAQTLAFGMYHRYDPEGFERWVHEQQGAPVTTMRMGDMPGLAEALVKHGSRMAPVADTPADVIPLRPGTDLDPAPDPMRFGKGLLRLRKFYGYSRMQLKVLAGLGNYASLASYESGARMPAPEVLDKLAEAFEVTRQELIDRCLQMAL